MSILIEGMAMPKEDEEIIIRIDPWGTVMTEYALPIAGAKAVPVPEPHGRLINASEAYDKIAEQEGGSYVDMDAVGMGLDETPTVIQASEV